MFYFFNYVSCQHPPVTSFKNNLCLFKPGMMYNSTLWGHTYFKKTSYMFAVLSIIRLIVSLFYLPKINTLLPTHFMVNTPFAATAGPQLEPQFSRGSVIQNRWCEIFPYQAVNDEVLHLFFPTLFRNIIRVLYMVFGVLASTVLYIFNITKNKFKKIKH